MINADRSTVISQIGDDAVIGIEDWRRNDRTQNRLSIVVSVPRSSPQYRRLRSVRFDLRGREYKTQTENYDPYALYGDRRGRYHGRDWREGEYRLRIRLFLSQRGRGRTLLNETIRFELTRDS